MLRVTLIGDSIRVGYEPLVREKLAGKAEVWGPEENGGDSRNVLAHLDAWALERPAEVIHLNCGLHDLKVMPDGCYQVDLEEYADNLRHIVDRLKSETDAALIWATSTPIVDERHQARENFPAKRFEADVERYNRAALEVVNRAGLTVNDLHGVIEKGGITECVSPDGVHMTERGYALLADAVARAVMT